MAAAVSSSPPGPYCITQPGGRLTVSPATASRGGGSTAVQRGNEEGGGGATEGWWKKVLDVREAKQQVMFSVPMIVTNVAYYFIPLVSVMFAGHLGDLQLAASNLANSWVTVTGLCFMIGLSGALETLCGQGYGAGIYGMLGVYLQASCAISLFFSIPISILWLYTKPILIFLHQDCDISEEAALFIKYLIPALFAYGFLHNLLRFLQTQSVVIPLIVCSAIPLILHVCITYAFVHWTPLAFKGAALAASVSLWISVFMLALYVLHSKTFEHTWKGFSLESLHYVIKNLKLAIPSAAMVCLEYWAFELLVILAGLMPNSEISTSLIAMCNNTEAIAYMIICGLSASASTRVSNELGAGNPGRAKHAMGVALKLSIILAIIVVLALATGHHIWAGFFSNSSVIITKFGSMTPLLLVSILVDSVQCVLSGVARGCGLQNVAVVINLASFYVIGMPIAILLGFKLKLHAKGLWLGLICGLFCQSITLLLLTHRSKWKKVELARDNNGEDPVLG